MYCLLHTGDDEWTFPQTPSSLQNSVWGSKLWPSQSPISNAATTASLPTHTIAEYSSREEVGEEQCQKLASTAEKRQRQSFAISITCGDKAKSAASGHNENLTNDVKADSCSPEQVQNHIIQLSNAVRSFHAKYDKTSHFELYYNLDLPKLLVTLDTRVHSVHWLQVKTPLQREYNTPFTFKMLVQSALIIFLTLTAAILAGVAIDTAFGPTAAPRTAPQQQIQFPEGVNTTAHLSVLSPSQQASVDAQVEHAADNAHWGLEQLNSGWQAATQQLDKVSRSLLSSGSAPAQQVSDATIVHEEAAAQVALLWGLAVVKMLLTACQVAFLLMPLSSTCSASALSQEY